MAAEYFKKRGHIVSINKTSGSIVVAYDAEEKSKQTFYVSDTLKFKMLPKLSLGEKVEISIDAGNIVRFIKPIDDEGEVVSREEAKRAPSTSDAILWQTCLKVAGQLVERCMFPENRLGAVGKVVVAIRRGRHGLEHDLLSLARHFILDEQRRTVPEALGGRSPRRRRWRGAWPGARRGTSSRSWCRGPWGHGGPKSIIVW